MVSGSLRADGGALVGRPRVDQVCRRERREGSIAPGSAHRAPDGARDGRHRARGARPRRRGVRALVDVEHAAMGEQQMNASSILFAVRDFIRPAFVFLVMSIALTGSAQAGAAADQRVTFLVAVAIVGWALFAVVLNDAADRAVDRANLGHTGQRPVADDRVPPMVIASIAATSAAASLIASWLLSPASLLAAVGGLVCAATYSLPRIRLAGRGLVTSLFLPMVYIVIPYATGRLSTGLEFNAD